MPRYKTSKSGSDGKTRQEAGRWLKQLREAKGLAQPDVAKLLDKKYFTTISQWERGIQAVPAEDWAPYARLLGVKPKDFAKRLLRWYDPHVWEILFGSERKGRDGTADVDE